MTDPMYLTSSPPPRHEPLIAATTGVSKAFKSLNILCPLDAIAVTSSLVLQADSILLSMKM